MNNGRCPQCGLPYGQHHPKCGYGRPIARIETEGQDPQGLGAKHESRNSSKPSADAPNGGTHG